MSISRTIPPGSAGGIPIAKSIERSTLLVLCALVLPLFLISCGPAEPGRSASNSSATVQNSSTGNTLPPLSVPAPPGSGDRPLQPGQSGTEYMPNGLPVLPARGINADMLFAEKITDSDDRFKRLENAVTDLRREVNAVMPAIVRLSAVEQDMQELLGQLQTLVEGGPADMTLDSAPVDSVTADALPVRPFPEAPESNEATQPMPALPALTATDTAPEPAVQEQPEPAPVELTQESAESGEPLAQAPPPPQHEPTPESPPAVVEKPPDKPPQTAPPPAPAAVAGTSVTSIRTGLQAGGVNRIVLDLNGPTTHHSDLDNGELLLLIEMPEAGWSAALNGTFADAPLLVSWTTEPLQDGKGIRLILQLRQKVEIVSDTSLKNPHRIVLDLKKSP
jgi:hypothetical protein